MSIMSMPANMNKKCLRKYKQTDKTKLYNKTVSLRNDDTVLFFAYF